MLTILGDALMEATRNSRRPYRANDWADRFVPRYRRPPHDDGARVNTLRDLRW